LSSAFRFDGSFTAVFSYKLISLVHKPLLTEEYVVAQPVPAVHAGTQEESIVSTVASRDANSLIASALLLCDILKTELHGPLCDCKSLSTITLLFREVNCEHTDSYIGTTLENMLSPAFSCNIYVRSHSTTRMNFYFISIKESHPLGRTVRHLCLPTS